MSGSNPSHGGYGLVRRAALTVGVLSTSFLCVLSCNNSTAPHVAPGELLQVSLSATQLAQGQTDTFAVVWGSPLPGDTLSFVLTGVGSGGTSLVLPAGATALTGSLTIPAAMPDGALELHVYIRPRGDSGEASITVLDTIPPSIGNGIGHAWVFPTPPFPPFPMAMYGDGDIGWYPGVTIISGVTDSAQLWVSDNHALAWAGWALGAPANLRDSVPLIGVDTALSIPMTIPAALVGTVDSVEFFARDVDNNLSVYPFGPGAIVQYADHPVSQKAHSASVHDLAFDMKHGLVLVPDPQNRQVDVFTINGLNLQATIALPHAPAGLDVTPGGDSALVLLDSTRSVAVINLANGYSLTTVGLPFLIDSVYPTDTVNVGAAIRIAADDRALITMLSPDTGVIALVEINLVTDSQRIIIPAMSSGAYYTPPMIRSPDASLVILPGIPFPGTGAATTYTAATHSYQGARVAYNLGGLSPLASTLSNAPYYFLGGTELIDSSDDVLGFVGLDNWFPDAIAANGRDVYTTTTQCGNPNPSPCLDSAAAIVVHYRVPDDLVSARKTVGQPLDISDAPQVPLVLAVSPDGKTLVGVGPTMLMAFDLTQSSPPSARQTRPTILATLRTPTRPLSPIRHAVPAAPSAVTVKANPVIHIDRFRR